MIIRKVSDIEQRAEAFLAWRAQMAGADSAEIRAVRFFAEWCDQQDGFERWVIEGDKAYCDAILRAWSSDGWRESKP
jgi:hypothetical protein